MYLNTDQIHKSVFFMIKTKGVTNQIQDIFLTHQERKKVIKQLFRNEARFKKRLNLLCQIPELN